MDTRWLVELFQEVGLEPDQAEQAADITVRRLLRRQRPPRKGRSSNLIQHMVRDPLVSVNRIIGKGDEGLPFVDPDTQTLSVAAFSDVLGDAGLDPVVSMAFAKVVVEAYEPKDLYAPVWKALGNEGELDLETLRRADWTPLRQLFPDLAADQLPTRQVAVKPKAQRPE
ncbi:MAG: hypothetical protein KC933_30995 [Myxococcales bacterium]|nr:hypothetical protein [Myxococcales bacterium]MCB9646462.1 hypothetical protein [Deltaproteobacteria bacterium]